MYDRAFRLFDVAWRLPCGVGCGDSFGFGEFRDDVELLHEAQSVPVDPAFHNLAVREAGDAYAGDVDLLSRWRNSAEITFMGTSARPTSDDCFAFGDEVLDRQSKAGKGIAVKGHSLLLTFRSSANIGRRTVVVIVVRCEELVCHSYMALVPKPPSNKLTHVIFVLFSVHGGSPF